MPRLLLRSAKDPFRALTPEAAMARNVVGTNAGNLLFGEAVHKALSVPGVEVVSNGYLTERGVTDRHIQRINEEFDAFVVPLANAFRPAFEQPLARLTAVIEKLTIPVVVVGVGAQVSPTDTELPGQIQEGTRRFLRAVLDRSAVVGVRGEITAACLRGLGFGEEHVRVIGCPSLFYDGRDLVIDKKVDALTPGSPLALNLTTTRERMAAILDANLERYPNLTYVAQEQRELGLLLWSEEPPGADPRMPLHRAHPAIAGGRTAFFVDGATWRAFMARQDFAFGTRIHGNIAALQAGTPAHVLTFDSRTLELARYHELPHTVLADVPADLDPAELYAATDMGPFNRAHRNRAEVYLKFLTDNGLDHVYTDDGDPGAFDRELAAVNFPPAVGALRTESPDLAEQLLGRLSWLRQGDKVDAERDHGAFRPDFAPPAKASWSSSVDKRLKAQDKQIEDLQSRLATLSAAPPAAGGDVVQRLVRRARRATRRG